MILRENPDRAFGGEHYDDTYLQDSDRFGHEVTFRVLERVFAGHLPLDRPRSVLDLGCGQGQVLRHVAERLRAVDPRFAQDATLVGLDISRVAIEQCEQAAPECGWILDSFQDFLDDPAALAPFAGRFDLVVNKGGLTNVRSQDEYARMLRGVATLLAPHGRYLYVQHKPFYQVWSNAFCADWSTDIFELASEHLGPGIALDERGAYARLHGPGLAPATTPDPARPRRLVLRMNDGSERRVFVSGDALVAERLRELRARPDRSRPFRFDDAGDEEDGGSTALRREQDRSDRTHRRGRPWVLVAGGRQRDRTGASTTAFRLAAEAIGDDVYLPLWPALASSTRHLCRDLAAWSAARPDRLVLGLGMEDDRILPETGQPLVDPDEFAHRLDWILDAAQRHVAPSVAWLSVIVAADHEDPRRGYRYRRDMAVRYAGIAAETCRRRGARHATIDLAEVRDLPRALRMRLRAEAATCAS